MATKLDKPVERLLDYEVDGRSVILGMDVRNNVPYVTIRLKGYKSDWHIDARRLADFVTALDRNPKTGREVVVNKIERPNT